MEYTGERHIPKLTGDPGHITLYEKSLQYVENKFVLDIASGSGWGTEMLSKKAAFVVGADISKEAVAYARKEYPQHNSRYCVGDVLNLPFPNDFFDVVNSIETFEHVPRNKADCLISEVLRVLKPGGLFVFSTPDGEQYPYRPKDESEYTGYHCWHYSRVELFDLLGEYFTEVVIEKPGSLYMVCKKQGGEL